MVDHYDIIVVGLGSMGSAAAYYTSKSGKNVLALDQFDPPHSQGSHTGGSRIIRKAYFEHADYVPLLNRAYQNWEHLENEIGETHFHKTGLLYFGDNKDQLIEGVNTSADKYGINIKTLSETELHRHFPQFKPASDFSNIFEENAGYINTDQTIRSYQKLALTSGCTLLSNTKVLDWNYNMSKVRIHTDMGSFTSDKIILCAGAWTQSLMEPYVPSLQLKTTRQSFFYFEPKEAELFHSNNFPCWNIQDPLYTGLFYGFPYKPKNGLYSEYGLKLAHHTAATEIDPNQMLSAPSQQEIDLAKQILAQYIPEAAGDLISAGSCMYTNSIDEDFIIDFLDESNQRVILASGFSGHGFKFVPAIGQLLAQMAIEGHKEKELNFLSLDRFKL